MLTFLHLFPAYLCIAVTGLVSTDAIAG